MVSCKEDENLYWRWEGPVPYVLQEGDSVFASIPDGIREGFHIALSNEIRKLGLLPCTYEGLSFPESGICSLNHDEASFDLYRCQAFILVLSQTDDGIIINNNWAITEFESSGRRGQLRMVYLTQLIENEYEMIEQCGTTEIPSNVKVATLDSIDNLRWRIRSDLLQWMGLSARSTGSPDRSK